MNIQEIIIVSIVGAVIGIIYGIISFKIEQRKRTDKFTKSREKIDLIKDIIHFDSRVDYATRLVEIQDASLEKIKAICGHLGVQVDIRYRTLIPSIEIIRSLSFMKEYLPEIDEQWQIYQNNDPSPILQKIKDKENHILTELDRMCDEGLPWDSANEEKKREVLQLLSNEYDRKQIMNEDRQENLTE